MVHNLLIKKDKVWILEIDIKGCFDNISHEYLITKLSKFPYSRILTSWLKAGILDNGEFFDISMRTSQARVISPLR